MSIVRTYAPSNHPARSAHGAHAPRCADTTPAAKHAPAPNSANASADDFQTG
jgi:hypothetical protein